MIHFVRLENFPDDLEFPSELQDRIRYDSDRRGLEFSGPMSKREFDTLWPLHKDSAYRRAIEELFRIATWDKDTTKQRNSRIPLIAGIGIAALAIVAFVIGCIIWIS